MDLESVAVASSTEKVGLSLWMERVVRECDRVVQDCAPEPVHDLRVALRRCRSIAQAFATFDPDRSWADMRKEGARLFKKLGELRDTQVMMEWVKKPDAPQDLAAVILIEHITRREAELKEAAAEALRRFDRKKWNEWMEYLPERGGRIPTENPVFLHLALERWHEAHFLHRQALRNQTHIGYHRLRVGLKKFRYITENFLPDLHEAWGPTLREIQDLLGEMHDLHVLLRSAIALGALPDTETRGRWRSWIEEQTRQRIDRYRQMMVGKRSLWAVWRAALPEGEQLESAILERLRIWASFRDPDCVRSQRIARFAQQLHDGLVRIGLMESAPGKTRALLRAAALTHRVGFSGRRRRGQWESFRMISELKCPVGWDASDFRIMALAVLHQKGALPSPEEKEMRGLSAEQHRMVGMLSGILRLAATFAGSKQMRISRLSLRKSNQTLILVARGYREYGPLAQKVARARYLLEIACGLPIIVCSNKEAALGMT
jgi:CHAD domain-containing protein